MQFNMAELKQPWVKYSVLGVVVIGVLWIIIKHASGGTLATTDSGGTTASDPGLVALQQQQNSIQASAASQSASQSYQLSLDAQQASEALAMAKLNADTSTVQQVNQITGTLNLAALQSTEQISLANINAQNIQASLSTQLQMQANSTAATVSLASITADTQKTLADYQFLTSTHNADEQAWVQYNTALFNAQTQQAISANSASVARNASDNSSSSSDTTSLIGGALGALSFF